MALTAEEHEASMECDEFVAASDAAGGKRPAERQVVTGRRPRQKLSVVSAAPRCLAPRARPLSAHNIQNALAKLVAHLTKIARSLMLGRPVVVAHLAKTLKGATCTFFVRRALARLVQVIREYETRGFGQLAHLEEVAFCPQI
ncbi:hypothetical protein AB1Y20_003525 [Prymnesium parvum]|uniref:Uncharacterized protein n=1 Tax=Prymnesium parvum TaxID=97485 RepID=A0AB34J7E0_PRYPA